MTLEVFDFKNPSYKVFDSLYNDEDLKNHIKEYLTQCIGENKLSDNDLDKITKAYIDGLMEGLKMSKVKNR